MLGLSYGEKVVLDTGITHARRNIRHLVGRKWYTSGVTSRLLPAVRRMPGYARPYWYPTVVVHRVGPVSRKMLKEKPPAHRPVVAPAHRRVAPVYRRRVIIARPVRRRRRVRRRARPLYPPGWYARRYAPGRRVRRYAPRRYVYRAYVPWMHR